MTHLPRFYSAEDGTEMVAIARARYEQLLDAEEELQDIAAAEDGRASVAIDGGLPLDVDRLIACGKHPLVAWRKHRGLSQTALAEKAGLTQAAIVRLEKASPGAGRPGTLAALARALDAPRWTLESPVPAERGPDRNRALFDQANPPEDGVLRAPGKVTRHKTAATALFEKMAGLQRSANDGKYTNKIVDKPKAKPRVAPGKNRA